MRLSLREIREDGPKAILLLIFEENIRKIRL